MLDISQINEIQSNNNHVFILTNQSKHSMYHF